MQALHLVFQTLLLILAPAWRGGELWIGWPEGSLAMVQGFGGSWGGEANPEEPHGLILTLIPDTLLQHP